MCTYNYTVRWRLLLHVVSHEEVEYYIIDIYLLLLNMGLCDLESCCIINTKTVLSSLTFQKMLGHKSIIFLDNNK